MTNKNFIHTDPVREYNEKIFQQTKENLEKQLGETLCQIMNADMPLENRIDACYGFIQDFSQNAAREMKIEYFLDIHTKLIGENTLNFEVCHNIGITPTEDMLEGRTDRLPVMKRGPDIPYTRV